MLRVLEHAADAGQQLPGAPSPRDRLRAPPESAAVGCRGLRRAGGSSPPRVSASVDLPAPLRPVNARAEPSATMASVRHGRACSTRASPRRRDRPRRVPRRPANDGPRPTARASASNSVAPAATTGARAPARRAPTRPRAAGRRATSPSTSSGGPSASTPPAASSTTTRSTRSRQTATRCSTTISVAPEAASTARTASRTSATPCWVEIRRRLVEQQEARPHREQSRQRESLLLAARQLGRRAIQREVEADRSRATRWTRAPDLVARHAEVLAGRKRRRRRRARGSPAASGSCSTSPERPRAAGRSEAVDAQRSPSVSPSSSPPRTPASPASSVDLPAPEAPSSSTRSPGSTDRSSPRTAQALPPGVAPAPVADLNGDGGRRPRDESDIRERPAPARRVPSPRGPPRSGSRAPVRASAFTSSQEPSPATTTPEIDRRDRVDDGELRLRARVRTEQVEDRLREPGARTREEGGAERPARSRGTARRRSRRRDPARRRRAASRSPTACR